MKEGQKWPLARDKSSKHVPKINQPNLEIPADKTDPGGDGL